MNDSRMISAESREVGTRLEGVVQSAHELVAFAEGDPALAAKAGVEVAALEAKMLLGDPALRNIQSKNLGYQDFEKLERLEGIVTMASYRMGDCISAMDAEESGRTVNNLGQIISVTGGAIGILKSFL